MTFRQRASKRKTYIWNSDVVDIYKWNVVQWCSVNWWSFPMCACNKSHTSLSWKELSLYPLHERCKTSPRSVSKTMLSVNVVLRPIFLSIWGAVCRRRRNGHLDWRSKKLAGLKRWKPLLIVHESSHLALHLLTIVSVKVFEVITLDKVLSREHLLGTSYFAGYK